MKILYNISDANSALCVCLFACKEENILIGPILLLSRSLSRSSLHKKIEREKIIIYHT